MANKRKLEEEEADRVREREEKKRRLAEESKKSLLLDIFLCVTVGWGILRQLRQTEPPPPFTFFGC
jgi:Na+/glutamate symporter